MSVEVIEHSIGAARSDFEDYSGAGCATGLCGAIKVSVTSLDQAVVSQLSVRLGPKTVEHGHVACRGHFEDDAKVVRPPSNRVPVKISIRALYQRRIDILAVGTSECMNRGK